MGAASSTNNVKPRVVIIGGGYGTRVGCVRTLTLFIGVGTAAFVQLVWLWRKQSTAQRTLQS